MVKVGQLFVGGLWIIGLAAGLIIVYAPAMLPLPMPYFTVPLIAGLVAELMLRPVMASGRIEPITVTERALAVLGASVISFVVAAILKP